jgi:hypothetical protein
MTATINETRPRGPSQGFHVLRQQRQVRRLYRLGERAVAEFIDELRRHHPDLADDLDRRLERYASVDPLLVAALGGDKFAPLPLHVVGSAP